jgi:hypothetical protein
MKFLGARPFFLCSVFALQALLGSNPAWALKASSLFESPASGKDGNCDGKDVDMMVTEALTLAENSINAIDTLLKTPIEYNDENKILAKTAKALWGVDWEKPWFKKVINIKDTSTLSTAKGHYELVKDKLTSNSVDDAKLTCGDKDWKWVVKLGDVGLEPADKLISDHRNEPADENPGYYLSKKWLFFIPSEKLKTGYGGRLCDDTENRGTTWWTNKLIMVCDRSFNYDTLASIIATQDSIPSGTWLDEKQTAGGVFLHEMMHWIGKNIIDVVVTLPEGKVSAYGFNYCAGIANLPDYKGKAVVNADNYRTFAMAITLNKIDWSDEGEKP